MTKQKNIQLHLKFFAYLLWISGFLFSGINAQAQSTSNIVKGQIIDSDDNMPIPGVNIVVKGSSIGTTTDFDGNYSLNLPYEKATLIISYLGYTTKEITTSANTSLNISLETDTTNLDEVIVVGYGTAKKETLTGSIEQVKSEVFEDRAVTNVALALQGQSPGLVVNRNTGRPGSENIELQIRGATSINGGSPLVIIDGAPAFDNSEFFQMNPDDIESISILKDGAASIYGSRAANGVILVTTKKGKGKMKVEFNTMLRANFIGINPPTPSMQDFGQIWLDAVEQDVAGGGIANYAPWSQEILEGFANGEARFYDTGVVGWGDNLDGVIYLAPANRYDELFGNNFGRQNSLSLSGSAGGSNYRLSLGESESQGALKTAYDGIKQYSVRLNTGHDVNEKLNIVANISLQKNIVSSPSQGFGRTLVTQDPPIFPSRNSQGDWYGNFGIGGTNSIASTTEGGRDDMEENIARLTLNLNYDLGHGFSTRLNGTFNHVNSRQDVYTNAVETFNWVGDPVNVTTNNPTIEAEHITKEYQTYGAFLDYKKGLGQHNFAGMLGLTAEKEDFKALYGQRTGFVDEGVFDLLVATGVQTNGGAGNSNDRGQEQEGLYSYLTRINYDYNEKYLIELVGRRDGSSRFAEGFKFRNYGSASIGWNLHKESFLENFDALSSLKVRASVGSSGNQVGIGLYDYVSTIGRGTELFGEGGTLSPTAFVDGISTTERTWEEVIVQNIGVDFSLFNNKLSGSFDTYERRNIGMLIGITFPEVLGGEAPETNNGNLRTTGWEAALNWRDTKGDFSYNIGINMSDSNNIIENIEGGDLIEAGIRRNVEGFPINSYFAWETDGFFQTQAEVDAYNALYVLDGSEVPTGAATLRVGDVRKVDLDGNGVINDQNADDPNGKGQGDVKFVGDSQAHYIFGINLGANYKNFDFTAFFQGHLEQVVYRNGLLAYPFDVRWSNQTTAYNGLTWTPENTGAAFPRLSSISGIADWNYRNNDFFAQNSQYIRLKTLVVGFSLPDQVIEKLKLEKLRIYFSGNDLFEFTSLIDGQDPEAGTTVSETDGEINRSIYPFQRTVAIGLNLVF